MEVALLVPAILAWYIIGTISARWTYQHTEYFRSDPEALAVVVVFWPLTWLLFGFRALGHVTLAWITREDDRLILDEDANLPAADHRPAADHIHYHKPVPGYTVKQTEDGPIETGGGYVYPIPKG